LIDDVQGHFKRESNYRFLSGQRLTVRQVGTGLTADGQLNMDVSMEVL